MKETEGGSFDPETISLLEITLVDVWENLTSEQRALTSKAALAERIVKVAVRGERDPARLRASAVMGIPDETKSFV